MRIIAFLSLALAAGCAGMTKPAAVAPLAVVGPARPPAERQAAPGAAAAHATPTAVAAPSARASAQAANLAGSGPQLDLKGLERRLKETGAIGVFTKLALKNSVDDLIEKFRAYHGGRQPPTLADLRPNYELLLMKVQSLIQEEDPTLADDVARSREAIWSVLADKSKFALI